MENQIKYILWRFLSKNVVAIIIMAKVIAKYQEHTPEFSIITFSVAV
jgi:hypothetical protein